MNRILFALLAFFAALGIAMAAVDVNTASPAELETIRGIGPALSAKIVEERKKGPFKNADDLQTRVRGIGEASVKKMVQAGLVVGGGKGVVRETPPAGKAEKAAPKAEKTEKAAPKAEKAAPKTEKTDDKAVRK
jgi:competence protein ComEA